jgi:aldehyde:ferredoxin oxidoreductase
MKIWRVNVHNHNLSIEDIPSSWERLGGRGLVTRILLDEVDPTCESLGPINKLIFAPGLLVGHMISSCDRISVGAKSPLTGGIKEANAGGTTGLHMTNLGMKALIIEGHPCEPGWWMLYINKKGVHFEKADDFVGLGVYQTAIRLIERYGQKVAISLIGPGGELHMPSAGIQNLDKDNAPSRIAARGGLGAVMGVKRIKAMIFDDIGCQKAAITHPVAFQEARKAYTKALMSHPQTTIYHDYGTAGMTRMCNSFGALPTRNFSSGQFEAVESLGGEWMRELLIRRDGEGTPTHACMPGCVIQCSNIFCDDKGKEIVSPVEYETIGLMGSNLGIDNLDAIARLNWEANDLGLDTIEIGAALGVAAEAGLMKFGDSDRAFQLLREIRLGTPLGRVLGCGAATVGRVFGVERVPVVKGQAMSSYEPRAIKGTGVTYATSPQGADHTSGLTIRAKVDHLDPNGQAELSRKTQINMAGYDTLGVCLFGGFGFAAAPLAIRDLIRARYGWEVGDDILEVLGKETLVLEREFNRKAGFTSMHDRLPEWMTREPLPPHNTVFDVPAEDLDEVFNW